jgi:hypothetical protein
VLDENCENSVPDVLFGKPAFHFTRERVQAFAVSGNLKRSVISQ